MQTASPPVGALVDDVQLPDPQAPLAGQPQRGIGLIGFLSMPPAVNADIKGAAIVAAGVDNGLGVRLDVSQDQHTVLCSLAGIQRKAADAVVQHPHVFDGDVGGRSQIRLYIDAVLGRRTVCIAEFAVTHGNAVSLDNGQAVAAAFVGADPLQRHVLRDLRHGPVAAYAHAVAPGVPDIHIADMDVVAVDDADAVTALTGGGRVGFPVADDGQPALNGDVVHVVDVQHGVEIVAIGG